jgi:hypothetical protein
MTNEPPVLPTFSAHLARPAAALPAWRAAGLRYHSYNHYLRQKYGHRVQRVSLDGGFTCPNVDGTVALGGCRFCDNRSFSPSRRVNGLVIREQLDDGIRRLKLRYRCDHFTAYFQPATNTYAPVEKLRELYEAALGHPQVVGLAIGTRPDCVPDDVLDLIEELARRTDVTLEFGMQTIHDRSLEWMNRGEDHATMIDAVERSRGRGFAICAHIMLGLPGESRADMLATARESARLGLDAVKIHNLYAVHGTPLADDVRAGRVQLLELGEYVSLLADFLELMPPEMVIERTIGDAPDDFFLGPAWCLDKPAALAAIEAELERRDSWQGKKHLPTLSGEGRDR